MDIISAGLKGRLGLNSKSQDEPINNGAYLGKFGSRECFRTKLSKGPQALASMPTDDVKA